MIPELVASVYGSRGFVCLHVYVCACECTELCECDCERATEDSQLTAMSVIQHVYHPCNVCEGFTKLGMTDYKEWRELGMSQATWRLNMCLDTHNHCVQAD